MQDEIRVDITLRVSRETKDKIDRLARERNVQRPGLVLQALGMLEAIHAGSRDGYYVGLTRDRAGLDTVLISSI